MRTDMSIMGPTEAAAILSDRDPAARAVCDAIASSKNPGVLLLLDELGIYGPDIATLFADVCGFDLGSLAIVVAGAHLGLSNRPESSAQS